MIVFDPLISLEAGDDPCSRLRVKGPFKKYVTSLGGEGSRKIVTKCDKGGRVKPKSDVTTSKKYRFNNCIRMTLKVLITPLHLLFM